MSTGRLGMRRVKPAKPHQVLQASEPRGFGDQKIKKRMRINLQKSLKRKEGKFDKDGRVGKGKTKKQEPRNCARGGEEWKRKRNRRMRLWDVGPGPEAL